MSTVADNKYVREVSNLLYDASRSIRILRNIAWPNSAREEFFRKNAQRLPEVQYPDYDPSDALQKVKKVRAFLNGNSPVEQWAFRIAAVLERSALLLSSMGTADFLEHSAQLYGLPGDTLADGKSTSLEMARHFDQLYDHMSNLHLNDAPEACNLATQVAEQMREAVAKMFGGDAPEVVIDDEVSSNAIAGRRRIRIRRTACFTDNDIEQLIHHEAYIHVATSLNGYAQPNLKILRAGHPGTTKTQEGLAVFAEFITGSLDLDRLRRLTDRIIAIQMAVDGADFIEVYRYFLPKLDSEEQAYENARRVFRGGLVTGKAPFTKDMVYLDGLLRVHNFLRVIVSAGRTDCLHLLFCGKLDIADLKVLHQFSEMGLLKAPKYLPPWVQDERFLLTYLAYSSFLNSINLTRIKEHYQSMLNDM